MSILPYSVGLAASGLVAHLSGADGATVEHTTIEDLTAFHSQADFRLQSGAGIADQAIQFHRINQELLGNGDIVPFRFPTVLTGVTELREFVSRNRESLKACLETTRGCVQMEVRLYPMTDESSAARASGTSYLRDKAARWQRFEIHRQYLEAQLANCVSTWKFARQKDSLRCFALVARNRIEEFRERANGCMPETMRGRVTGPWPATQFMPIDRFAAEALVP